MYATFLCVQTLGSGYRSSTLQVMVVLLFLDLFSTPFTVHGFEIIVFHFLVVQLHVVTVHVDFNFGHITPLYHLLCVDLTTTTISRLVYRI